MLAGNIVQKNVIILWTIIIAVISYYDLPAKTDKIPWISLQAFLISLIFYKQHLNRNDPLDTGR